MNAREKKFLFSGIGAGVLGAAIALGAYTMNDQHARHSHDAETKQTAAPTAQQQAATEQVQNVVGGVQLSPDEINAAGVQLAEVRTARLSTNVDAFGRVEQPESQLAVIPARIGGRIERLHVQYTGQQVKRGQPVAEVYSPEAAASADEYQLAVQSREKLASANQQARDQADELVSASKRRLELWGISGKQLDGGHDTRLTIYSPVSGTVVERKVAQGQYISAGETMFTLADLSTVWVKADVYESQLPQIRRGQRVELRSEALGDKVIRGEVEFIEPAANQQTRTVPVHVHVANPGMKLVPGMFVRAMFVAPAARETLVVPRTAVLDTGTRKLVYVASGEGAFEARDVEIGAASEDMYPVMSGLKLGEKVVTNGNFLIDSQTRLSGGMTGLFGGSKEFGKGDTAASQTATPANAPAQKAKLTFAVDPNPPKGGSDAMFHITLTDAESKPIPDAQVKVTLVMPAMPSMGMPEMRSTYDVPWVGGMYMGKGQIPMAGPWNVTVEATRNGQVIATQRTRFEAK
jgi:multidrug efflux pump subunit AcrA (membrane-fusion protein)